MGLLPLAAFRHVFEPLTGRRVGYLPMPGNVGDRLLDAAARQLMRAFGASATRVSPEGGPGDAELIAVAPGGNMGSFYREAREIRERALGWGLPVIVLPQSFTGPELLPYARVFVRERASWRFRPDAELAPDLALGLNVDVDGAPDLGVGLWLRGDAEAPGPQRPSRGDPALLCRTPEEYLRLAARHTHVVTDRLHFAIAALLCGRRATLLPNSYHKNRAVYECWLRDLGCGWADVPPVELDPLPPGPRVSVVMPVFNGARFVRRAVDSVRAQTFADWELLAVDDGSTDDSAALLDAAAAADPRVRVLRHPHNRGLSAARNTALGAARGELVAYLDCDDEFHPDHLGRAWALRDRGEVLVFRYHQVEDRDGHPHRGRVTSYDPAAAPGALVTDTLAVPLGVVHRRVLLDRVGRFDESLGRYRGVTEDADLWRRFARAGAVFRFVPHESGRYYVRSDSLSRTQPAAPAGELARAEPDAIRLRVAGTALGERAGPPRVLFASYHCFDDPTSGAALCTHDLFDLLTARGWACAAFTGPHLDTAGPPVDERLRTREGTTAHAGRVGLCGFSEYRYTAPGGYPVTVFAPDPPAARRPAGPDEARAFAARLEGEVRRFRPDVVLHYGGDPASGAIPAVARAAGAAPVFWLHNFAYAGTESFRGCAAVVVPSEDARAHYAARGLDPVVLPGPWNWDRFRCADPKPKYVTFVNPEPAKGVFWFARIAEVLNRTRPDIPVLVVEGRGDVTWLARCGAPLGGGGTLRRMRNTADPRRFYRLTRVLLVPSLVREALSRVAVEALANGIPVLGSGRGGLAEVLAVGGARLDIPDRFTPDTRAAPSAEEVAHWVAAIERLWDDPGAYAAASERAKAGAARAWHPDVLSPRWAAFLEGAAVAPPTDLILRTAERPAAPVPAPTPVAVATNH